MNDGFLLVDKPLGLSSRQLIDKIKPLYEKKIGHTGTLDPLATGMMVLALGDATRFSQWIVSQDKAYIATLQLGAQTSTDDLEGDITHESDHTPTQEMIEKELSHFLGPIEQVPPTFSAIHINGKRAYQLARAGHDFEMKSRSVTIHAIQIQHYDPKNRTLTLYIHCQSGTYIRSIARDLGLKLQCFAHLSSLRRLWVSPFENDTMYTLEDLPKAPYTLDDYFKQHPHINLSYEQAIALAQGRYITLDKQDTLACYYQDLFLGFIEPKGSQYKAKKLRSNVLSLITGLHS